MADENLEEREQWRKIMEQERSRKKSLEELRNIVESQDSRNPKDLLKLILKLGEVQPDEAAKMLSVDRNTLNRWSETLEERKYIERENTGTPNEVLRPTKILLEHIRSGKKKSKQETLEDELENERRELVEKQQELAKERQTRLNLEERLEQIKDEQKKRQAEADAGRMRLSELQSRLLELERQVKQGESSSSEVDALRLELEREHEERRKIENELRAEKELLEKEHAEAKKQHASLAGEEELSRREKMLAEKEEELSALLGDDFIGAKAQTLGKGSKDTIDEREKTLSQKEEELSKKEGALKKTAEILDRIKERLLGERSRITAINKQLDERTAVIEKEEAELEKTLSMDIQRLRERRMTLEQQLKEEAKKLERQDTPTDPKEPER